MLKKVLAAMLCSIMATAALSSCGKQIDVDDDKSTTTTAANSTTDKNVPEKNITAADLERFSERSVPQIDLEKSNVKNFTAPKKGDTVIIMKLKGYEGEIKIKLFSEYAEKGVENFVGHAENGYYDGLIFHRIISDFMIQGGDPLGTGMGGESIWGEKFDGGVNTNVIHAAGAVAYANSGSTATNGSQFYIVTGDTYAEEQFAEGYPEDAKQVYMNAGGTPFLDGGYTVFGQVYDGLDIVFAVQDVETDTTKDPTNPYVQDRPIEDVVIEYVKVGEYNGEETRWFISDYLDDKK